MTKEEQHALEIAEDKDEFGEELIDNLIEALKLSSELIKTINKKKR